MKAIIKLVTLGGLLMVATLTTYAQKETSSSLSIERLINAQEVLRYPDSALSILSVVEKEALNDSLITEFYRSKGSAYFYKGILDSAISNFSAAMASMDSGHCTDQYALVSNGLAVVLHAAGLRKEAITYYTSALGCVEFRNDSTLKLKIYNNLSILNRELGDFSAAQTYLDKAFQYTEREDPYGLASLYNSRGQIFLQSQLYDSAHYYFERSNLLRHPEDKKGKAIGLNNLGYVASLQGDLEKAMRYYQQAAIIREEISDLFGSASIFINMGNIAVEQGELRQAQDMIRNAELLNQKVGSPEITSRILAAKSSMEEAKGNTELALALLKRFNAMDDSLRAEDIIRESNAAQYTIALTEAENKVRRVQKEERIREENLERQRTISFALAIAIAVFIGLFSLLLYQLKLLSDLRKALTKERDEAEQRALVRRKTLHAVVHELRTPMNAIISLAELIKLEEDEHELRKLTGLLQKSSERLLQMTNNILTFSRIEEGAADPVLTHEHVSSMLREICTVLGPQSARKGLDFHQEIENDVFAKVDRSMLEIVAMNLIGNAIKYTDSGSVSVGLKNTKGEVILEVSDTGPGIPKHDHAKIFEAFYQSSMVSEKEVEGSGLGLSICRHYVEQMKGSITLESEEGKGTTFRVSLPQS